MSFGFSVSDLVLSVQLAHNLWQEARDAPGDFRAVSAEVASLKLVFQEVQETVIGRDIEQSKQAELEQLMNGCNSVLLELQTLLHKYKRLGTQSRRTWDRLRWGKEPVEKIRLRLVSHVSLLTSFRAGLLGGSLARIEKLLEQLTFEHRAGMREQSVISAHSIQSAQEGNDAVWRQIGRELEDVGITQVMIREHKDFIIRRIKSALQSDRFDEGSPVSNSYCDTDSLGPNLELSGSHISAGDQIDASDFGADYGGGIESADSIESWTADASMYELGNLVEIQQTDSVQVHIEQLPNQDRLRNLAWEITAKNLKR